MNAYSKVLIVLAVSGLAAVRPAECRSKDRAKETGRAGTVATVGDTVIEAAQLEQWIGHKLTAIVAQEYDIKSGVLEENITRLLMEKEAARRGLSTSELERREIRDEAAQAPTGRCRGSSTTAKTTPSTFPRRGRCAAEFFNQPADRCPARGIQRESCR